MSANTPKKRAQPSYYLGGMELQGGGLSYLAHRHGKKWNLAEYELHTVQRVNIKLAGKMLRELIGKGSVEADDTLRFVEGELLRVAGERYLDYDVRKIVAEAWEVKQ